MLENNSIHGYTLLCQLGEGGMAEVWQAVNAEGNYVAIKILKAEFMAHQQIVQRFEEEATVMERLDHPNICRVYGSGLVDGRQAIVMEYLEGQDLASLLRSGRRFEEEELTSFWNSLVAALTHVHGLGIVHRDIKPSNIFLTREGSVKLLDFGVAKVKDSLTLTKTGTRIGTPLYMSPEQVNDSKHLDWKSDAYSLAVTFYHLVGGTPPYDSETESEFEIQRKIVYESLYS